AREPAAQLLAEPGGTFEVRLEEPRAGQSFPITTLRAQVMRELVKRLTEDELAAGLSSRHGQSPRLTDSGRRLLPYLKLSDAQVRTAQRMLDGEHALGDVLGAGIGARTTWQLIYQLQVLGAL